MEKFNEQSEKASEITAYFESLIRIIAKQWDVEFKEPAHDVARRFLNEIVQFEPLEEERRSRPKILFDRN